MGKKRIELTQEIVHELLDYDRNTGLLIWKWRDRKWFKCDQAWKMWNKRYAGTLALKKIDSVGRKSGKIFGEMYLAHRIIFLWMKGRWPKPRMEVDHENQKPADNRWVNLKERPHRKNMQNLPLFENNKSGHVGVYKDSNSKRKNDYWYASIGGKYLGYFSTYEEAVVARKSAERKYGYHPNSGKQTGGSHMGSQTYRELMERRISAEEAERKKREEAKKAAQWRASQYYGNILNGGNSIGRIITSLPRMFVWR